MLLLSRDEAYEFLNAFAAAEITRTIRGIPQEIVVSRAEGLPLRCAVNLDHVHTVPKALFEGRAGRLGPRRAGEVKRALGRAWAWPELVLAHGAE
jgi:mRNA interferase MazF